MCGELEYTSTSNSPSDCPILSSQAICENWGKNLSQPEMKLPTGCYQPRCQNNHLFCKYFHTCPGKAPRSQRHLCMGVNRHLIVGVQKAQPTWQNVFVTKSSRFSVSASRALQALKVFFGNRQSLSYDCACRRFPVMTFLIQGNCHLTGLVTGRQGSHVGKRFFPPSFQLGRTAQAFNSVERHKRAGGSVSSSRKRGQAASQISSKLNCTQEWQCRN